MQIYKKAAELSVRRLSIPRDGLVFRPDYILLIEADAVIFHICFVYQ